MNNKMEQIKIRHIEYEGDSVGKYFTIHGIENSPISTRDAREAPQFNDGRKSNAPYERFVTKTRTGDIK